MSVQYLSNKKGQITAVQVSDWQIQLFDKRLASIKKNPERVKQIEGLLKELGKINK